MAIKEEQKKYNIARAGIWYTIGNLIIKGLPFFTLPLFVRILSTADFGLYNTYISYENILSIVLGLGFSGTVKTAKFDFEESFEKYLSSLYMFLILSTVIACPIIVIVFGLFSGELMTPFIVGTLVVHSFSTAVFNINGVRFVILGRYKTNLAYTFLNTFLNIGISLILCLYVFNTDRYIGRITGTAISFIVVMIIIIVVQMRRAKLNLNKEYINYALKMGIPLVPHLVSVTLLSSCDKIMIQNMIGNAEAGIYSLSVNLVAVLSVFVTSIENAWAPWFYSSLKDKIYDGIKQRNDRLILIFAYLTCGFMLVGPELIRIFSTQDYTDSIFPLVPLAISVFLNFVYLIPVNLEYFNKKTYFISAATISCALVNLLLNYIFIKDFGYAYAAHATCISKCLLLVFHYVVSKRLDEHDLFSIIKSVALIGLTIAIGALTLKMSNHIIIRWGVALLFTLIMAYMMLAKEKSLKIGDSKR